MPATVPACCGSKWRSRLICGKARDMFVRSIKAIVYIMRATGIMRIQRIEVRHRELPVLASCCSAVVIETTEPYEREGAHLQTGERIASAAIESRVFARAESRIHELRRPYS